MDERDNWDLHWSAYDAAARHNPAQSLRRQLMVHWLKKQALPLKGCLLDIGSGQGDLISMLVRLLPGLEIAGVEMSATGIAQSQVKAPSARFFQRDLQFTPADDDPLLNWANVAVCSEVLEHVDEPEKILANAARYLAPGARLMITVPGGPMSAFDRHIGHRQHFDSKTLTRVVQAAGLTPERVSGVGFPFFNLYRMTVIARGKALIKDADGGGQKQLGGLAKLVMRFFSLVLKRELNSESSGWQMIAEARKPL